jgi:hypothetical protein
VERQGSPAGQLAGAIGGRKTWYIIAAASTAVVETGVNLRPTMHRVYQSIAALIST